MWEILQRYVKYIAVAFGVIIGCLLMWKRREQLGIRTPLQTVVSCVTLCALSVLATKIFATMEFLISGKGFSFGATSTYGVYFVCPPVLLLLTKALKWNVKNWFDVYALCIAPTVFFLRINCLISGCCGGRPIGSTGLHWPTREAEMVFYTVMLLVLLRREKQDAPPGTAFPLLMAAYGAFRFIEEWFREADGTSLLHLAHGWSLVACVIGLGLYFELSKNGKRGKARGERSALKC